MRLPALCLLERIAAFLRRIGLGALVDRAREPALRALGEFTGQVGDVILIGDVALHSHYLRQLQEGNRERATAEHFRAAVGESAVVLDIGAHLGSFAVVAAKRGAKVLAFEPNPPTLSYLRRKLGEQRGRRQVRVVERAVGAKSGTATFFLTPAGDESSLHAHAPEDEPITVQVTSMETAGLLVDVIKMDVEGGEVEALDGMREPCDAGHPASCCSSSATVRPCGTWATTPRTWTQTACTRVRAAASR